MGRNNRKVSNETKIEYAYNNKRYQRRFGVLTPIEKYNSYLLAA